MRNEAREALILAGGFGTRLQPVVRDRPKPIADVGGRPFVDRILDQLVAFGYQTAVLCLGYKANQVIATLGNAHGPMALRYSVEDQPLGTAGALVLAADQIKERHVLAMNGDSFCQLDLRLFEGAHRDFGGDITMAVLKKEDRSRSGTVEVDDGGRVMEFSPRPLHQGAGLINAGVYMFETEFLRHLPKQRKMSLEAEIFPAAAADRRLYAKEVAGAFIDIGTPESYSAAQNFFPTE